MDKLPESDDAPVVRTDFSDPGAWEAICKAIRTPFRLGGYEVLANVDFVDDPSFEGLTPETLPSAIGTGFQRRLVFLVDRTTLTHQEHPILVVDLFEKRRRPFRVIPSEMASVENNLSLANLDYRDFVRNLGPDGIFRGFR
ncbi:MAG: hypothetical protein BGO49_21685 [Planctomycetales bacterium 71-10]|nr:MAG: hypothetical protein BGO49_21685 [Planctomycetales bacterium 71-10]